MRSVLFVVSQFVKVTRSWTSLSFLFCFGGCRGLAYVCAEVAGDLIVKGDFIWLAWHMLVCILLWVLVSRQAMCLYCSLDSVHCG